MRENDAFHRIAAAAAILATGVFAVLLVAAHRLKPELDPALCFISELATGNHGWVMQSAFFVLAASNIALLLAIQPWLRGVWARGGAVLFLIGTIGVVLGGLFVTDPINTPPDAQTTSGRLHNLGGGLGLLGFLGTLVFSVSLLRNSRWRPARMAVVIATTILVLGFLHAFISISTIAARHDGVFGPDTPVGWPNRIGILSGCLWIVMVAWQAARLDPPETESDRPTGPPPISHHPVGSPPTPPRDETSPAACH